MKAREGMHANEEDALFGAKPLALTALASTAGECSEENWDGYLPIH